MKDFEKKGWEWKDIQTPSGNLKREGSVVLKLLIPFMVAGLFYLWGKLLLAIIVAIIALAFLLFSFVAPSILDLILTVFEALGRRLGKLVSFVSITIFYGIIFIPSGFLNRLLNLDSLEFKWLPVSRTYWVSIPQIDSVRFFSKPFLSEIQQSDKNRGSVKLFRFSRAIYQIGLSILLLNFVLGFSYHALKNKVDDSNINLRVYADEEWTAEYFREFRESYHTSYQPYIGWLRDDYSGQYINIKNGVRNTYQPHTISDKPLHLYIFGGSTTWGTGARDNYTIPSYISKIAEKNRIPLEVNNLGESGFVNWQNVLRLVELCADGKVPDLVIFYEGANDVFAKLQTPDRNRVHQNIAEWEKRYYQRKQAKIKNIVMAYKEHSLFHMIGDKLSKMRHKSHSSKINEELVKKLAQDTVSTYAENSKLVKNLADAYGFKVWFFWQPVLYTRDKPTVFEHGSAYQTRLGENLAEVYRAATKEIRMKDFAIDLSEIFHNRRETIYIDWAHVSELGNNIIAERMYAQLQPILQKIVELNNSGQKSIK